MTLGSLFSGIGGLELGLEWAGLGPTLWQVEKDPYAQQVLARHWPSAARFDDVRHCGAHSLAPVDLICGGFPCQDLSYAGKGAGLTGERSGLWTEYVRIIRELRPRIVVAENVPALLARGLGTVLGDLAALGYDAWWDCIPAAAIGAPHRRDRLFVVAYRAGDGWERGEHSLQGCHGEGTKAGDPSQCGSSLGHTHSPRLEGRSLSGCGRADERPAGPAGGAERRSGGPVGGVGGGPDGLPAWLDRGFPAGPGEDQHPWEPPRTTRKERHRAARLRALGNAVVPQVGYIIGCAVRALVEAP